MKKWLVGLMAAGLCAASAWADGVATLPVAENYTSTQDWTALTGFSGSGVGTYADGRCKFDKNNQWLMVQFDGTPGELTFDVKGNTSASGTAPAKFLVEESADAETWSQVANLDETAFSTDYASFGPYTLGSETRYVRWTYANKYGFNLGLNNVAISSGGPEEFSVTFNKENWFKVALGEASSVTAIPKNGVEPYTFLWESDTPELDGGTTDTLEIPATLAEGDYTVACLVTEDNGEGDAINALIGFTVEAIPVLSGDVYTLVKSADDFEEGADYLIVSYSKDKFTSALKNAANGSRIGVEEVVIAEDDTVTTESDAIVWTIQAGGTEGQYVLFNEAAGVYAAGPKSEGNNAQLLSDGSDALAQWTLDFGELPAVAIGSVAYPERQLTRNSTATYEYFATYKGSGTKPYLFKKAGEAGLSVTLDKANGFTVDLGTADSITATAKNGVEPYTYAWTSDTPDLNGTGETLAIPATLAEGDYTVQVEVTDAESNKASKQIGFSVVAPAVKYAVNVALGILNGSVTTDVSQAAEGDTVTVTATPEAGYKLGEIIVNNGDVAVTGNTFVMPAEDVLVTASFEEVTGVTYVRVESADDFEEGAEYLIVSYSKDKFTSALKNAANGTRIGVEEVVIADDNTVTTESDAIVWTIQASGTEGQYVLFNEAAGVYAAGPKSEGNNAQLLSDGSDALAQWTLDFADAPAVAIGSVAYPERQLTRNSTATYEYFATYKGSGTKPYLFKKAGASGPSVSLSASATEAEIGDEVTITATAKGFSAEPEWSWTGKGTADGATFTVDTTEAGAIEVTATATAGEETASKSVTITVSEPAVKYAVNVAIGILNGTVTTDVPEAAEGDTVTVTATPEAGYRLVEIIVNNGDVAVSGNTFVMPAQDVLVTATFEEKPPVTGDVLTNEDVGSQSSSYVDWTATKDSGAVYAGLTAGGSKANPCIQLRSSNNNSGIVMTESSGSDVVSVSIEWNSQTTNSARKVQVYGSTTPYSSPADLYGDNKGTLLGEIPLGETYLDVAAVGSFPYIGIRSASSPIYLDSVTVSFGGASGPSVSLSASATEAEIGDEVTITATAKGFSAEPEWSWTGKGTADGATFTVDTSAADVIEVTATATAGEETASKSVTITVREPAQKYAVVIADGILNGTVTADKEEAEAGETVTLTVEPIAGYKLAGLFYNGIAVSGNTFEMPAEDVLVTASFEEVTGVTYVRVESADDFEEGAEYLIVAVHAKGNFTSALKNEASGTRIGVEEVVVNEDNTIVTDSDAIVWTIQAGAEEGQYVLYNAAKGVYAAATKDDNVAQLLDDGSAALAQWTLNLDNVPAVGIYSVSYPERWLSRNSTAASAYFATYKGTQTVPFLFKKSGAAKPSISVSGEPTKKVGETFELQFTLKNYEGEFTWVNDGREGGSIDEATGLYTWTPSEEGNVTITVKAMDGDTEIASKEVALTVLPGDEPPPEATLTCEPASVTMAAGESFEVTLTLTGTEQAVGYIYFEGYDGLYAEENPATIDLADLELAEGTYTLVALAVDSELNELARTELPVTVTGEGPQPGGEEITEFSVDTTEGTLSFAEPNGAYTVESTQDLVNGPWEAIPVTVDGGYVTVPMEDGPRYYRVAQ